MIYILCFILTPLLIYFAEKQLKKEKKISGYILLFLAILIPSLVAGLRSLNVGRDIGTYVTPAIKNALSMNFADYMKSYLNFGGDLESGYRILIYICSHISSSPNFSLFVIQFLTMLFVVLFAYKNREKMNMTFVMIVYMLTCYCTSLNYMRQNLAIAIILLSVCFFEKKKYIKTLLLFLLAFSFHKISIVALLIYFFIWLTNLKIPQKRKTLIYYLVFISMILATIFYSKIVYFFTNVISILPEKYYKYTTFYFGTDESRSLSEYLYKIFWIVAAFIYKKFVNKEENPINIDLTLFLLFTDFLTLVIAYQITNASRVGLYFYYLGLFYIIPNFNKIFKNNKTRKLISLACIAIMFMYWIWVFVIYKWCETFPYTSDIIKFLH